MIEINSERYKRHIALPEIGPDGQRKIADASVLVIGCGALGNIAATYLAAAGIGRLVIADFDTIDVSNLHRQVMYATCQTGLKKAETLKERLIALNPDISVSALCIRLDDKKCRILFPKHDFIIDATDNSNTKFTTSIISFLIGKPCTIGGIKGFYGQLTTYIPGSLPYHEIFSKENKNNEPGETVVGVFGPAPGVIGCLEAAEALKYITGTGELLTNRLLTVNLLDMKFQTYYF